MALTGRGSPISGGESAKMIEECRPNYQKQAVQLKRHLDEALRFNEELTKYVLSSMPYDLKEKEFNLYELKGFMEFHIMKIKKDYEYILKKIEDEKADGSK